jgi:hypothetical protein
MTYLTSADIRFSAQKNLKPPTRRSLHFSTIKIIYVIYWLEIQANGISRRSKTIFVKSTYQLALNYEENN